MDLVDAAVAREREKADADSERRRAEEQGKRDRGEPIFAERVPIGLESADRKGYAKEPKVSDSERLLYGEMAEVVRYLGEATVAAERGYSLVCKRRAEFPDPGDLPERPFANEVEVDNLDKAVCEAWDAVVRMRLGYRNVAARSAAQYLNEGGTGLDLAGTIPVSPGSNTSVEPPVDPGLGTS